MKKVNRRIVLILCLITVCGLSCKRNGHYRDKRPLESLVAKNSLAKANVEAITENETLDCSYNRDESSCEIYVGVGGQVKVFNKGVISAGADGMVVFPGKVVCSSGGSYTCRPVECVDIYEVIFN